MKAVLRSIIILSGLLLSISSYGQNFTQTIRGRVIDKYSQAPIPGTVIQVWSSGDPSKKVSGITDPEGYYEIIKVPVGRVDVAFTMMGYEPIRLTNIELIASKELILNVQMVEQTTTLNEVTIIAEDKEQPKNEMVTVSGRQFTIEESKRYAGANNDISRMASNFAGVQRTNDAVNDIVIRGNSPFGLIWRMEDVDIPNPNHFGGVGATGGPVSMLNNNVLANSDFLTGAFPSMYGNGISGVFDLQMRNGNYDKHEFLGQIGFNGFELGAEGPINRERRSSYLVNARYSTLGVMSALGVNFGTGTAIPEYQDLTFKLNLPTQKAGTFTLFGIAGNSAIDFLDSETKEEEGGTNLYSNGQDLRNRVRTMVVGASHKYLFNNKTYYKLTLSASSIWNITRIDTLDPNLENPNPNYRGDFLQTTLQAHAYINRKVNASNNLRLGFIGKQLGYDYNDSIYVFGDDRFRSIRDAQGSTQLLQPYANWEFRKGRWTTNLGLHLMHLTYTGATSVEPRFGMKYEIDDQQSLSFGYGLHSQMPLLQVLFKQVWENGVYFRPNEDLGFTKSHHFVLGYDLTFLNGIHTKVETYYQHVFDAGVRPFASPYSTLNAGSFDFALPDTLVNGGFGRNYGVDITVEKFLQRGFYFLGTASLYQSEYKGSDEVWRSTAFNGNYVLNLLGGKEFNLRSAEGARFRKRITVDGKLTTAGGQRYTPIDVDASVKKGEAVYDLDRAYGEQFDPYFRFDIRIGFALEGRSVTQEWALDIQNITNHQNPFGISYDETTQSLETTYQLGLFPMFLYRVTF